MLNFKKWFSKGDDEGEVLFKTPEKEKGTFVLKVDDIELGILQHENAQWTFRYTEEFKKRANEYNRIVGFPDLNKIYRSEVLWPFFLIRIPGLKQPAIREIIKKENIDQENEVQLLKRFGRKTIANPYELLPA